MIGAPNIQRPSQAAKVLRLKQWRVKDQMNKFSRMSKWHWLAFSNLILKDAFAWCSRWISQKCQLHQQISVHQRMSWIQLIWFPCCKQRETDSHSALVSMSLKQRELVLSQPPQNGDLGLRMSWNTSHITKDLGVATRFTKQNVIIFKEIVHLSECILDKSSWIQSLHATVLYTTFSAFHQISTATRMKVAPWNGHLPTRCMPGISPIQIQNYK